MDENKTMKKKNIFLKSLLWLELYKYLAEKFNLGNGEEDMLNPKLIRSLLLDLIRDGEYTLEGISYAAHVPHEVICDIAYGINMNPSVTTSMQIILHYIIAKRSMYTEEIRRVFQLLENDMQGAFALESLRQDSLAS